MPTNELLHTLIREQNRALWELVRSLRADLSEEDMSAHIQVALEDAEAICQKPTGDSSDEHTT